MPSRYLEETAGLSAYYKIHPYVLFQNWIDPPLSLTFSIVYAYNRRKFSLNEQVKFWKFKCALHSLNIVPGTLSLSILLTYRQMVQTPAGLPLLDLIYDDIKHYMLLATSSTLLCFTCCGKSWLWLNTLHLVRRCKQFATPKVLPSFGTAVTQRRKKSKKQKRR